MDGSRAPCLECARAVPADARVCPECGYGLAGHDRRRRWLGGLGMALTLSVVLAPLGLPLLHRARRHRLAAEGTVTRRATASIRDDVRRLRDGFLSLDRDGGEATEYRREPDRRVRRASEGGQR